MTASADLSLAMKMTGMRVDAADRLEDLQAGLVGESEVEQDDIGGLGADARPSRGSRGSNLDSVTGCGECLAYLLGDQVRVIIDQ